MTTGIGTPSSDVWEEWFPKNTHKQASISSKMYKSTSGVILAV
uniref:Uncharacterized protein n=1 Tax=Arundo donax TaxID=35708 RepID=A0A0A9DY58_ARUDO